MAMAWKKAKEYCISNGEDFDKREDKIEFKDGDFAVTETFYGMPWMRDKERIPAANDETLERIKKFAEKNDLIVYYWYGFTGFEEMDAEKPPHDFVLKRKYTDPKNWKEKIRKHLPFKETVIHAGDYYFGSSDPKLFEEFGREVYNLKTEAGKQASK